MILEGRLFVANRLTELKEVEYTNDDLAFSMQLENALVLLCKELDIPIPLWLKKNTHEFAAFHQTLFFADQFNEKVKFDRFQIKWTK